MIVKDLSPSSSLSGLPFQDISQVYLYQTEELFVPQDFNNDHAKPFPSEID